MRFTTLKSWLKSSPAPTTKSRLALEHLEARENPAGQIIDFTWDGGANTQNWNDPNNWDTNTVPVVAAPDVAHVHFNGPTATHMNVPNLTVARITFVTGGSTVTLDNNLKIDGFVLGAQITNGLAAFGTNTFTGPGTITTVGAETRVNLQAGKVVIENDITGAFGISLFSTNAINALELRGTNTYTGDTFVDAGVLQLNGGPNAGVGTGPLQIGQGGAVAAKLQLLGLNQIPDALTVQIEGNGTLDVNANLEAVGGLTLNGGKVAFTGGGLLGVSGNVSSTGASSVLRDAQDGGTLNLYTGDHTFGVTSGTLLIDAAVVGTGKVVKAGAGTLTFSQPIAAPNTYSGGTAVNAGSLILDHDGTDTAIGSGPLAIGDGVGAAGSAVVRFNQSAEIADAITVTIDTDGQLQTNGKFDQLGDIVFDGGSILMDGGGFTLLGDIVAHGNAQITTTASGGTITLPAGDREFRVDSGWTLSVGAAITGNGGLKKDGLGTLAVTGAGANTYAGHTFVNRGTMRLNKPAGTAAVSKSLYLGLPDVADLVLAQNDQIPDDATVRVFWGDLNLNGFDDTVGPLILDSKAQVHTGAGTLTLNGNVAMTSTGSAASMTGNFDLGGQTRTFSIASPQAIDLVIDGVIKGTGGLVFDGEGTVEFKGALSNTYTGTTSVQNGTLVLNKVPNADAIPGTLVIGTTTPGFQPPTVRLGAGEQIADTASVWAAANGHFDLDGYTEAVAGLVLGSGAGGGEVLRGTVILLGDVTALGGTGTSRITSALDLNKTARTFLIGADAFLAVDGGVSLGSLVKEGAGTLQLNADNTLLASMTLNAGELWVHGSQPDTGVTVTGGTLNVTGAVGTLTVTGGGVSPGLSDTATPTAKDFILGAGTFAADIYGPGQADTLFVTGGVDLTGGTLDLGSAPNLAAGQSFTIIDNDLADDDVVGAFNGYPEGHTFTLGGHTFRITYTGGDGNDVVLTAVIVNTPPTISDVADVTDPAGAIAFAVGDAETPAADLQVTATSSDTTLFPAGSLVIGGSGAGRTITLTPAAGQTGTAVITLTVTDGGGTATDTFTVTVATTPPTPTPQPYTVGAGTGGGSVVRVYHADGTSKLDLPTFEDGFAGGVRTATADVTGDGVADVIAGSGPGRVAEVRIYDGATGALVRSVQPFGDFTGGVFVAAGDFDGDGKADVVVTPDQSGGPRVTVLSGADGAVLANFFGIDDENFRGGARAALGDVNGDGRPDLIVSAGFGGGPRIAVFDGTTVNGTPTRLVNDFFAFEEGLRNGAYVASGDMNGDGFSDLIFGGGPGGGPRVLALDAQATLGGTPAVLANFFAGNVDNRGGVRVAAKNLDGDARADLVVGDGDGAGSRVTTYLGKDFAGEGATASTAFDAFDGFLGGVFVG